MNAEAQARVDSVNTALEELRRKEGLWITGEDGEPQWLAPDDHGDAHREDAPMSTLQKR